MGYHIVYIPILLWLIYDLGKKFKTTIRRVLLPTKKWDFRPFQLASVIVKGEKMDLLLHSYFFFKCFLPLFEATLYIKTNNQSGVNIVVQWVVVVGIETE